MFIINIKCKIIYKLFEEMTEWFIVSDLKSEKHKNVS
jgi:hypothetical protein